MGIGTPQKLRGPIAFKLEGRNRTRKGVALIHEQKKEEKSRKLDPENEKKRHTGESSLLADQPWPAGKRGRGWTMEKQGMAGLK